ncbi:hypothetical protein ACJX0J_035442, partial [Zea mays]
MKTCPRPTTEIITLITGQIREQTSMGHRLVVTLNGNIYAKTLSKLLEIGKKKVTITIM